ncbi:rab11 family-interacting protein 1-like isoform X3 [Tigriopus californicus]|uniref:rab11 family-interacting protein 1-like isoform X3 n=1 Tax=Tigriopus californicus TaxID=6832 RepID=UPI0027DA9BE6|nr:rab11 family-interacting protein 1-like isoform X3 [Tigriopus californicus]
MWSPTHVQVLVKRARGLILKGKNGTNDAFVTIALGKEKYQTSVKEKAADPVEWCEQCEFLLPNKMIPAQGNTAEVVLTVLHRNFLGVDEFLGLVNIPLRDFDVYERPKTKWYSLKCKPGQTKADYRGDLEVRTSFTVKSVNDKPDRELGSTADLKSSKKDKHKGSLQSLNKAANTIGGSLLSLGTKEKKNLKKFAKTVGSKVDKMGEKAKKTLSKTNLNRDDQPSALPNKLNMSDLDAPFSASFKTDFSRSGSDRRNRDPGVESDDEDDMFKFDALSHRSSGSSLNVGNLGLVSKTSTPNSASMENVNGVSTLSPTSNDLYRKSFGTPNSNRKDTVSPLSTPTTSRSILMQGPAKSLRSSGPEPVLDEWEAKLLGKKGVPYQGSSRPTSHDAMSLVSQGSQNSFSAIGDKSSTLPHDSSNRSRALTPPQETPSGRKKIIPVGSDFESSPSPESPRSTFETPNVSRNSSSVSKNESHHSVSRNSSSVSKSTPDPGPDSLDEEKKRKSIGLKVKTGYKSLVDAGRTGSLFNLNQLGKGLKDKEEKKNQAKVAQKDFRKSTDSIGGHSRNHSDGSSNSGFPPSGTRVVLGRETTPTPQSQYADLHSKLPREVTTKFDGTSRDGLIEMVLDLQAKLAHSEKKQSELEDYIDTLLMKVIQSAPDLLQKNNIMEKKYGRIVTESESGEGVPFDASECRII